ncbi:MAG: hypothetical protein KAG91_00870 [Mycoplasmataceae bacterium]|nr:hypothetical protein [Mycoplasmataceae bacterium]
MFKKQFTPKNMVIYGVYTAIILFMTLTPNIGFITVGPITVSTMLIPIVIGTAHLGFKGALFTSTVFGLMAFILGMTLRSGAAYASVDYNVGYWFVTSFISRLIMGLGLGLVYIIFKKLFKDNEYTGKNIFRRPIFWLLLSLSITGQVLNSSLFLGFLIMLGTYNATLFSLVYINLIVEFSIVLVIPLVMGPLVIHLRKSDDTKDKW